MSTITWKTTTSGNFADPTKWSTGSVPGAGDDAIINAIGSAYTVTSAANETIDFLGMVSNASLDITGGAFSIGMGSSSGGLAGTILIENGTGLNLAGTIVNSGLISVLGAASTTQVQITSAVVTLSGGGTISLGNAGTARIVGSTGTNTLDNLDNKIVGDGLIGGNFASMVLINEAAGIVNANAATALTLNTGSNSDINKGIMESTSTGGLVIGSSVINTGGTILASGAGSVVTLNGNISGGLLTAASGGSIALGNGIVLDGIGSHTLTNATSLTVTNGDVLYLNGTINNKGSITLASSGNSTGLRVNSSVVSLTGAGSLIMTDNANNYVNSTGSTEYTLNNVNNTISGAGALGAGGMTFVNGALGRVTANGKNALVLNTQNFATNLGLMQSTSTGGLQIVNTPGVNDAGGTIQAVGAGSHVDIVNSTVEGGTLKTSGGGVIETINTQANYLDGGTEGQINNTGTVLVNDLTNLGLTGTINNTGTILVDQLSSTGTTNLIIGGRTTLTGTGNVVLSNASDQGNRIYATFNGAAYNTLDNFDDTISGAGQLGIAQLTLINEAAGIINANQTTALIVDTSNAVLQNFGLIENTNTAALTGGLEILNTFVMNTGTVLAAGANTHVDLANSVITGGTLATSGGGVIDTAAGTTSGLDGLDNGTVNNTGTLVVTDNSSLNIAYAIDNTGTVQLASQGNNTNLIATGVVTALTGAGTIAMGNNGANRFYAGYNGTAYDTIDNIDNTISGAGQLGIAQLTLINEAAGIINANQTTALTLNTSNAMMQNFGKLEDTGTGGLAIVNTYVNNIGTVLAAGTGAHVDLSTATIAGGTLVTSGGGVIDTAAGTASTLDGLDNGQINNTSSVVVTDNSRIDLSGTINNTATIQLASLTNNTDLRATGLVTMLTGKGTVAMGNGGNNRIYSNFNGFAYNTLDNINNTISGAGQLGIAQLTLINEAAGIINANNGTTAMTLNTSNAVMQNRGLLEDTGAAGLAIVSTVIKNTGTVRAVGSTAHVDLETSTIAGGTLATSGGGVIDVAAGFAATLDGLNNGTVNNTGTLLINNNSRLDIAYAINNTSTIELGASVNNSDLRATGFVTTLTGKGHVVMSNSMANRIYSVSNGTAYDTLVNADNTITGAGQLGIAQLTFINGPAGVINANQVATKTSAGQLVINTANAVFTNQHLLESTTSGGLVLQSTVFNNAAGTISAAGAASHVDLSGATIEGGKLTTGGGGVIQTVAPSTLDGFTLGQVNNTGTVEVQVNSRLDLYGVINNTGRILDDQVGSTGNTDLRIIGQAVTLTGGGTVQLTDNANNRFYASDYRLTLVNLNNTITGAGQLGIAQLQVSNSGKIIGSGVNPLLINTGSENFVNNATGQVNATGVGGIVFQSGILTNNGTIAAANGSAVTMNSSLYDSNNQEGELFGGTWNATSTGGGATLSLTGGPISLLTATVDLSGAGSVLQAGNGTTFTPLENSLMIINTGGVLNLAAARNYTTSNAITDSGQLVLAGGTFSSSSLTVAVGGVLVGFGKVQDAVANAGRVEAKGGTLTASGAVTGSGTLQADASSTLLLNGAGNTASTVVDNGTITLGGGDGLTVTGAAITTVGGMLKLAGGTFHSTALAVAAGGVVFGFGGVSNVVANSGRVEANGGTLTITGNVTGTGSLQADAASTLVVNGANNTAGSVLDNGVVVVGTSDALSVTGNLTGTGKLQTNGGARATLNGTSNTIGTVVDSGTISLGPGDGFAITGTATVSGVLKDAGGTLTAGELIVASGGVLSGFGSVTSAAANSGRVEASGGTLTASGAVTGSGTLQADASSTLLLNGVGNTASTVVDNGTVTIGASDSLDVTGSVNTASTGLFILTNASLLEVGADSGASNQISFLGAAGDKLAVDAVGSFGTNVGTTSYTGPLLKGFTNTVDTIDLKNLIFNSGTNVATIDSYTAGTGLLQLHSGTTKATLLFNNLDLGGGNFHLAADSGTGTLITHS